MSRGARAGTSAATLPIRAPRPPRRRTARLDAGRRARGRAGEPPASPLRARIGGASTHSRAEVAASGTVGP